MVWLLEKSRFLALIGVFGLLLASLAGFLWGVLETYQLVLLIGTSHGSDGLITVELIKIVDIFLIAMSLLLFSTNLYELFIGDLHVPEWMEAHNLTQLKANLSSMIVLVMAVKFLEKLLDTKGDTNFLNYGIAVTLVSVALIAFGYFGNKH